MGKEEERIPFKEVIMDTGLFRTRHESIKRTTIPKGKDYIIGVDAGYSGTKVYYENGYFCFPSYVKQIRGEALDIASKKDILYRDHNGEVFMIGYTAQEMIGTADTNDSEQEMFSRKRYGNQKFKMLCNTAIGMALLSKHDNRDISVVTGLPSSYVAADTPAMKKIFEKPVKFALKIGEGPWQEISYSISPDHIKVIPQPAGSLYSVMVKEDGNYTADARDILCANTLILDIGFGTLDLYGLRSRNVVNTDSFDACGMKAVLKKVSKMILEETGEDIRIQALQHVLETGTFTCVDEETMNWEEKPIAGYLKKASREVFKEAMEQVKAATGAFRDYRYLIVTGGTGEAWYPWIREYLSRAKGLTVFSGNRNDGAAMLYSNVRGYYMLGYVSGKKGQ